MTLDWAASDMIPAIANESEQSVTHQMLHASVAETW